MPPPRSPSALPLAILALTGLLSSPGIGAARVDMSGRLTPAATTERPPSGVIDDQKNWATIVENTDNASQDNVCLRCFETTQVATNAVEAYNNIVKKSKKLRSRRRTTTPARPASNPNGSTDSTRSSTQNSTMSTRTLNQPGMIVVHRLRVARSSDNHQAHQRSSSKNKHLADMKEAEFERLKAEQESQRLKACTLLFEVHYCLRDLQNECIADLSFHTYETFFEQSRYKLLCVDPEYPNVKPFRNFGTFRLSVLDEDKVPIARPLSSPEEVRARLHQILPDRPHPRTLGVELKQQPDQNSKSFRRLTQAQSNSYTQPLGRILLVPACFVVAMVFVLLAGSYYIRPWKKDGKEGQDG